MFIEVLMSRNKCFKKLIRDKKSLKRVAVGNVEGAPYCVYGITKDSCMHCNQLASSGVVVVVVWLSVLFLFQLHWKPVCFLLDASL